MDGEQTESLRMSELAAISRYWTPYHIDVTNLPARYAAPKAAWIDKLAANPRLHALDASDRLARRRVFTHAVVQPQEITVLPAIRPAAAGPSRTSAIITGVKSAIARRLTRLREPAAHVPA